MSKELKYVLIAALSLFSLATLIVVGLQRERETEMEERAMFAEQSVKVDSVSVEPDAVKDAYAIIQEEEKKVPIEKDQPVAVDPTPQEQIISVSPKVAAKPKVKKYQAPEEEYSDEPLRPEADRFAVQTAVLSTLSAAKSAEDALRAKGFYRAKYVKTGSKFAIFAGTYPERSSAFALKKKLDQMRIKSFVKELE